MSSEHVRDPGVRIGFNWRLKCEGSRITNSCHASQTAFACDVSGNIAYLEHCFVLYYLLIFFSDLSSCSPLFHTHDLCLCSAVDIGGAEARPVCLSGRMSTQQVSIVAFTVGVHAISISRLVLTLLFEFFFGPCKYTDNNFLVGSN